MKITSKRNKLDSLFLKHLKALKQQKQLNSIYGNEKNLDHHL